MKQFNRALDQFVQERLDPVIETRYYLRPLTTMHLYGESREIIGMLSYLIMGVLILSIACINFINLTTAYASTRIREISIRKSAGASKRQLIIQFMGETYLLLLIAIYLGFFITEHLTPVMFRAFAVERFSTFRGFSFWAQVAAVYMVTGLLAGLYPAIKISGFKPQAFLSSSAAERVHDRKRARRILIVLQFRGCVEGAHVHFQPLLPSEEV